MRITIELPDDLHARLEQRASERRCSVNNVVERLIRSGLARSRHSAYVGPVSPVTGVPVISVGRPVTAADIASLDDEQ